ncbi:hypothetical protein QOT17_022772, partial [Balamuthia mandrillaris]
MALCDRRRRKDSLLEDSDDEGVAEQPSSFCDYDAPQWIDFFCLEDIPSEGEEDPWFETLHAGHEPTSQQFPPLTSSSLFGQRKRENTGSNDSAASEGDDIVELSVLTSSLSWRSTQDKDDKVTTQAKDLKLIEDLYDNVWETSYHVSQKLLSDSSPSSAATSASPEATSSSPHATCSTPTTSEPRFYAPSPTSLTSSSISLLPSFSSPAARAPLSPAAIVAITTANTSGGHPLPSPSRSKLGAAQRVLSPGYNPSANGRHYHPRILQDRSPLSLRTAIFGAPATNSNNASHAFGKEPSDAGHHRGKPSRVRRSAIGLPSSALFDLPQPIKNQQQMAATTTTTNGVCETRFAPTSTDRRHNEDIPPRDRHSNQKSHSKRQHSSRRVSSQVIPCSNVTAQNVFAPSSHSSKLPAIFNPTATSGRSVQTHASKPSKKITSEVHICKAPTSNDQRTSSRISHKTKLPTSTKTHQSAKIGRCNANVADEDDE